MGTPETSREPCPDRILGDAGSASPKGNYASPKGARPAGGFQAVRMNAGRVGGSFAFGGLVLALIEGTEIIINKALSRAQKKEVESGAGGEKAREL